MNFVPSAQNQFNANQNQRQPNQEIPLEKIKNFIFSFKVVSVIIMLALFYIVYLFYNPPFLAEQNRNIRLIEQVEKLTDVPQGQTPIIAQITDVESLKSENEYQAEIYANAKNEDYVFGYGSRMVIYREDDKQIIYDGPVPQAKIEEEVIQSIVDAAGKEGISLTVSSPVQLSVVNDPDTLRNNSGGFYEVAVVGDIIAIYPEEQLILLYRPSENRLVNSGSLSISIN
jgi:hypothetical protein